MAKKRKEVELDFARMLPTVLIVLLLIAVAAAGVYFAVQSRGDILGRGVEVRAVIIRVSDCADCFDADALIGALELGGVNVTQKEYFDISSSQGKSVIAEYNLTRAPAVLLYGDENSTADLAAQWSQIGERRKDALVTTKQKPVFIELSSGEAVGRVKALIILPKKCVSCGQLTEFMDKLVGAGIVISNTTLHFDAEEQALIRKYNISVLPAVILSKEAQAYDFIVSTWRSAGTIEPDGSLVLRSANPPFWDVPTQRIRGLVNVTLLIDKSCEACYDPQSHVDVLKNPKGMMMQLDGQRRIDISGPEGRELLARYSITSVPTVIVTGDTSIYSTFLQIWPQVGTQEKDGAFVFRNNYLLKDATYEDLLSNRTLVGTGASS